MRISDWSSDVCSSDLLGGLGAEGEREDLVAEADAEHPQSARQHLLHRRHRVDAGRRRIARPVGEEHAVRLVGEDGLGGGIRSEEHTSELQSLMRISYAVFCLKNKSIKLTQRHHDSTQ